MHYRKTILVLFLVLTFSSLAFAHCDTLGGPVVTAGRKALDTGNINLALIWVQPAAEPEIRAAFDHAQQVRALGGRAAELADRYFLETLVRVHRTGEGETYTGLKPAGATAPGIAAADAALTQGSPDLLVKDIAAKIASAVREKFSTAAAAKGFAPQDVNAGRQYVKAYVEYLHYVERLYATAEQPAESHGHAAEHGGGEF